jgi:hypothetical protein
LPQFAHGFAGLGLAAATIRAARTPALAKCWPGVLLLLAYLPDVLDWTLHLAKTGVPHGAMCSLPMTALLSAATLLLLVGVLRERNVEVSIAALAALGSHLLLDLYSGGIPLWWPFSAAFSGADPFELEDLTFRERVPVELAVAAPLLAFGLGAAIVRRPGRPLLMLTTGAALGASICAVLGRHAWLAATAVACLALLWLLAARPGRRELSFWNLAPAAPVLLLAGVQVHGWARVQLGLRSDARGDHAAAIAHYRWASLLRPMGLDGVELYRVGRTYIEMGREDEAHRLFMQGLAEYPDRLLFLDALVHLHLSPHDPRYYDPLEALRLARIVHERATKAYYRQYAADLVKMAEAEVRKAASRGAPPP